jgi:hypothetical protein
MTTTASTIVSSSSRLAVPGPRSILLIGSSLTLVFVTILYEVFSVNDTKMYTHLQSAMSQQCD